MDTTYKLDRVNLDDNQHADAKEFNDLINALVDKDGNAAKEAIDAAMAIMPDMSADDRFSHLYKVLTATLSNQLHARAFEKEPDLPVAP